MIELFLLLGVELEQYCSNMYEDSN